MKFLKRLASWKLVGAVGGVIGLPNLAPEAVGPETVWTGQVVIAVVWLVCQTAVDIVGMVWKVAPHEVQQPVLAPKPVKK